MHSSKPQQVRRRNFELEQYDGSCRQSFPFVKWIEATIESMGAMNILDKQAQPDFEISDAQRFAKAAYESRQVETSEAFKRAHQRWQQRTIDWNVDTIALGFMDPHNLQAIVAEEERIGIKPVEPTYVPPSSAYAKYGKRDLDKTEEQIHKQQKIAGQVLVAIKNRCKQQVLDHADQILTAPGVNPRTKLIAFVKVIEARRLCDLTVVSIVQDDIKGLNPIASFPDAVDNIIAINMLQEELTLMGQPYSERTSLSNTRTRCRTPTTSVPSRWNSSTAMSRNSPPSDQLSL